MEVIKDIGMVICVFVSTAFFLCVISILHAYRIKEVRMIRGNKGYEVEFVEYAVQERWIFVWVTITYYGSYNAASNRIRKMQYNKKF
jgi:hypothetical protein